MIKKSSILTYTTLFTPDEESGGFTVEVPALPGCVTDGETLAEAKKHAAEAIQLYLETLEEDGLPFPEDVEPNFFKQKIAVSLRPQLAH
jgi:antitoxin HicB